MSGEYRLLQAVIQSAVATKDIEYFHGETFEHHCQLLGVDSDVIREQCLARIKGNKS